MSWNGEKSWFDESSFVGFREILGFVGFQKLVLFGLVGPLLLVSNDLSEPNKEPQCDASKISESKVLPWVGVLDGCREPVNEEDLVIGGEDEVEEFD